MADSITYDNFSLQDTHWKTKNIRYKNLPERSIDLETIAREDGFKIVNVGHDRKIIEVEGMLVTNTNSTMRTLLDSMKSSLRTKEKNLDIAYGGSTIRYEATVQDIEIPDDFYHITACPYRIIFVCQPFGKSTTPVSSSYNNVTGSTYTNSINVTGSAEPRPVIQFTVDSETSLTKIQFQNKPVDAVTNSITVSQSFNAGNVLIIDCGERTVKLNGNNSDFTGVFPTFYPSTNSITITFTSTAHQVDTLITYYPSYL